MECDTCHKWVHQICGLYNNRFMAAGEETDGADDMLGDEEEDDEEGGNRRRTGRAAPFYECPRCKLETEAISSLKATAKVKIEAPPPPPLRPRARMTKWMCPRTPALQCMATATSTAVAAAVVVTSARGTEMRTRTSPCLRLCPSGGRRGR